MAISDFFDFFVCLGEGTGEFEAPGRGDVRFVIDNSRRGSLGRGGGGQGAGKVSAGIWGGGGQIFFFGVEFPTKLSLQKEW